MANNIDITDSEEEFEEDSEDYRPLSFSDWMRDILVSWGPAIFAVFFIRSVIAEPFRIPSGSMVPTLEILVFCRILQGWNHVSGPNPCDCRRIR